MSVAVSIQRLIEAHRLTEEMLCFAREGEWEPVAGLEQARQQQLERLELSAIDDVGESQAFDLLHKIQNMNRELLALSQAERARVREALLQLRKGGRARQAYR